MMEVAKLECFGYTIAASLFLYSGLNGWAVFAALILAGFFISWLVNLSGKPSVVHGIPYPVFARVSMGVFGANFLAMARGLVAMFWYGAQTWVVVADMLKSFVHHLAHWFILQSHANRLSHHKLGIARHVSIGGLFHLSSSFLPLFMGRFRFAISLS